MDVRTQDAVERLMRGDDFKEVLNYISGRRDIYMMSLSTADLTDVASAAKSQGMVLAMEEVLRIPEDAEHEKRKRTTNG